MGKKSRSVLKEEPTKVPEVLSRVDTMCDIVQEKHKIIVLSVPEREETRGTPSFSISVCSLRSVKLLLLSYQTVLSRLSYHFTKSRIRLVDLRLSENVSFYEIIRQI